MDFEKTISHAKISWFAEPRGAKLLKYVSGIDEIIVLNLKTKGLFKKFKEIKKVVSLYRKTFDLVIDFQGFLKSAILAWLLKGKAIGFNKKNLKEHLARHFYQCQAKNPTIIQGGKYMMKQMMRKSFGMIIVVLFLLRPGYCETKKISSLEEWYKWPCIFHIDEQKVCVIDKNLKTVVVYSRKDYRPLFRFGRPGQGPGEFSLILRTYVSPESIMITTSERISIFSHQGKLLEEIKNPQLYPIIKLENRFFQKRYHGEIITYEILDNNFKRKKELYSARSGDMPRDPKTNKFIGNLVHHHNHGLVAQHYIVIGDTEKGFYFKIFNHKGRLIREISHQFDRRRVNTEDKKMLMDELIERAKKSRRWELLKSQINYIFSKYFPAYFDFFVQDEKLYVFGYPMPNKKQNVSIFDLKGELLSSKIIPYIGGNYFRHQKYFIYKGFLYYLFDNEESEKWELRAVKIE